MTTALSDRFFEKGRAFLGVQYPFICGAMTWVSDPRLVSAVANAGGFACLAGGNAPVEVLAAQIEETRRLTDKPFGVNLIPMAPVYPDHLALVRDLACPYIVYAGLPRRKELAFVQENGAKTMCFAATETTGKRMLDNGADALIIEGMEAGGHVGQVSLAILIQQVLFKDPEIPVFAGGGIVTGRMCAHMFLMGAAGVQFGTRFAVSEESSAHPKLKEAYIKANARDAVSTPQVDRRLPVIPVRAVRNKATEDFSRLQVRLLDDMAQGRITRTQAQHKLEGFWENRLRDAVVDGDVSYGSMMAGQSVGLVNSILPVKEIINALIAETEAELKKVRQKLMTS